jgi:membrane peptidoglycan carboxypeptidase
MASAYGTFAAAGTHIEPYSVLRVTRDGAGIHLQQPPVTHPFTPKVASEVTDALRGAVSGGSAKVAAQAGPGLAGLPGTALDDKAGWFVGYDSTMASAVSLFRIDPKTQQVEPLTGLAGSPGAQASASYPAAIWTRYLREAR